LRVGPLVEALMSEGYSVQLKHDDRETSWEDHGFVKIFEGERLIAERADYQHNPFSKNSAARTEELITAFKENALDQNDGDQALAENKEEANVLDKSDSGSSTAVPSDGREV